MKIEMKLGGGGRVTVNGTTYVLEGGFYFNDGDCDKVSTEVMDGAVDVILTIRRPRGVPEAVISTQGKAETLSELDTDAIRNPRIRAVVEKMLVDMAAFSESLRLWDLDTTD